MTTPTLRQTILALISTAGLVAAVSAATPPAPAPAAAPPAGQPHEGRHEHERGGAMMDPFLMAVRKLELTPSQQQSVRSILDAARDQHQGMMQAMGENLGVLGNPGDPGYAAAVQAAKTKAANMIQRRSDLDVQIFSVLTPEQRAKLPQILADMKAKFEQRRNDWQQRRGGPGMPEG